MQWESEQKSRFLVKRSEHVFLVRRLMGVVLTQKQLIIAALQVPLSPMRILCRSVYAGHSNAVQMRSMTYINNSQRPVFLF